MCCRKTSNLGVKTLDSGRFSDTRIPVILEKSLYFSELSDHSEFPSRLKKYSRVLSCRKTAGQVTSAATSAANPPDPAAANSKALCFFFLTQEHQTWVYSSLNSNHLLQYLGKVLGHPFTAIKVGVPWKTWVRVCHVPGILKMTTWASRQLEATEVAKGKIRIRLTAAFFWRLKPAVARIFLLRNCLGYTTWSF